MWVLLLLTFIIWYRVAIAPMRRWRHAHKPRQTPRHPMTLTRSYPR